MTRLDPKMLRQMGIATAAVSQWTLSILIAVLLGAWLDQKLGSKPILLIGGSLFGFCVGGYGAFLTFKSKTNDSSTK
jgi:F0F1-type ATP synthase assembly protein I